MFRFSDTSNCTYCMYRILLFSIIRVWCCKPQVQYSLNWAALSAFCKAQPGPIPLQRPSIQECIFSKGLGNNLQNITDKSLL